MTQYKKNPIFLSSESQKVKECGNGKKKWKNSEKNFPILVKDKLNIKKKNRDIKLNKVKAFPPQIDHNKNAEKQREGKIS